MVEADGDIDEDEYGEADENGLAAGSGGEGRYMAGKCFDCNGGWMQCKVCC